MIQKSVREMDSVCRSSVYRQLLGDTSAGHIQESLHRGPQLPALSVPTWCLGQISELGVRLETARGQPTPLRASPTLDSRLGTRGPC